MSDLLQYRLFAGQLAIELFRMSLTLDPSEFIGHKLVIDNFMANRANLDSMVESPKFRGGGELDWSIRVYPRGKDGQNGFAAYLHLSGTPKGLQTAVVEEVIVRLRDDDNNMLKGILFDNITMAVGAEKGISLAETDNIPVAASGKLIVTLEVFVHLVSVDGHQALLSALNAFFFRFRRTTIFSSRTFRNYEKIVISPTSRSSPTWAVGSALTRSSWRLASPRSSGRNSATKT